MKKLFLLIACAVLSIGARAQFSGSGNGTEADPYRIYTDIHLAQMANYLNQEGVVFELMKDVDLSTYINENSRLQGWTPIGVESAPFMGVLKGNGHTISGLMINRPNNDHIGLFGYVNGATITNINLKGSSIKGKNYVGGIIGTSYGNCTISDCHIEMTGQISGFCNIGGLIGYNHETSTIKSCDAKANLSSTGYEALGSVGGLCGTSQNSTIQDCTYEGNVNGKVKHAGGLFGSIGNTSVTNVTGKGNVSGDLCTGGIAGNAYDTNTFNNVRFTGSITGTECVSGGIGNLETGSSNTFNSCHHKGTITNTGDYTGGIVGKSDGGCITGMESSSHFGDITGKNFVGGLVGARTGSIEPRPVYYGSTSRNTNTQSWGPSTSTIVIGGVTSQVVNNSTSIGNITGEANVGGLIGSDKMSVIYTAPSDYKANADRGTVGGTVNRTGSYLWRNNSCVYEYVRFYYSPEDSMNTVYTTFTNSYYSGTVNGTSNVGGIAGYKEGGTVQQCYTHSSIYGDKNVGGVVGQCYGHDLETDIQAGNLVIKSNVTINSIVSASESGVGRIYGGKENNNITIGALGSLEGNRALTQTNVTQSGVAQDIIDDEQNGTSVGPSMLKLKGNYVSWGWNFDDNWNILETECYPYKKYQTAPPIIKSGLESHDTSISGQSVNGGTVYMYHKNGEVVSTQCNGNVWTFDTEPLQSGAQVQIYAEVEGFTPSYLTIATVKYPGSGTEEDPWQIFTAEDLQGAYKSGYYKLMNDIDLTTWINENSPVTGWPAIGRNSGETTFINGDGHKVTGLWVNTTEDYTGLFSNLSAGVIKNLTVEVANGKKVKGGDYTGILIGRIANGQLQNCFVKGDVEGGRDVGGVTGYSENNTINAVTFEGKVTSYYTGVLSILDVGGFAGSSHNDNITSVHSFATISATGKSISVGGIVGTLVGGTITKSHAEITLTSSYGTGTFAGGLVGDCSGNLSNSYSTGTINATTTSGTSQASTYAGGLVGVASKPISNCYSTVKVLSDTKYTAGLCAYATSTIDKCYAMGDVYGRLYGGGVVAQLYGARAAITNSVAANNKLELTDQSSWGCRVVGGFSNGASEPNTSNYALSTMQVSLNGVPQKKTDDAIEGIAKAASELMKAETYINLGWDFAKDWGIEEGKAYPYLLWENEINPVTEITLDHPSLIIEQGKNATLVANVMPLAATNKRLNWTSSNSAIATVVDGVITAIGIGSVDINATSTDGSNITVTCKVTVVANKEVAIAELQTLVDNAQSLYDNSSEGESIGQYQSGARAALLAVIRSVKAMINSTMSDEEIVSCTNDITNAVTAFKEKEVKAGEDTDVTKFENVVFFEKAEAATGQQLTLSLMMNNTIAPTGFQCDLYLPAGITVATDDDDFNMISLSTKRTTLQKTNYFDSAEQRDGSIRIMCSSTKNYTFAGNDGEVALVTLNISDDIEEGDYPIVLKNIVISDAAANSYEVDYVKSTLTISSYTLGDANNDSKVNVSDFSAIAGYIMGVPPLTFVEKAADVNTDGKINVSDLTGVATIILYGSLNQPLNIKSRENIIGVPVFLNVNNYSVNAGDEFVVDINIDGDYAFSGYQLDMMLPKGISVKTIDGMPCTALSHERTDAHDTDFFTSGLMEDCKLRILAASTHGNCFEGNNGSVAHITLVANEDARNGDYTIKIDNAIIANKGKGKVLDATEFMVSVNDVTGIQNMAADNVSSGIIYDLTGKIIKKSASLKGLNKGVYIINGKKVIK